MLKSNSKKVNEKIKTYIIEGFEPFYNDNKEYLPDVDITNYTAVCNMILISFYDEKVKLDKQYKANRISLAQLFADWCSGLCGPIDTTYYYNVCAKNLLGDWLEETEEEKACFSESDAENMITTLLWREITKHANINIYAR